MSGGDSKVVFVTVGTTSFDKLIETVMSRSVLQILNSLGYTKIVFQIGRGKYLPKSVEDDSKTLVDDYRVPSIHYFTFKDAISDDINSADLVISHAGAGSILETLDAKRPLIVVINEDLMGNHQMELAGKLAELGHLVCCTCSSLADNLTTFDVMKLRPMESGQPTRLAKILDKLMRS